jgi:DNA-directed RNA polymerase subunit RPC12/RpoP
MEADAPPLQCPACRAHDLEASSIIHHLICAYVGPDYDFEFGEGYRCPKCVRALHDHDRSAEIVGDSARCRLCGTEFVVLDATAQST